MKKIGIIAAMTVEFERILRTLCNGLTAEKRDCFDVYCGKRTQNTIYVVKSGIGEIGAAAATQFLISAYKVDVILNYGFVGALSEELKFRQIVAVDKVVHYDFDTSAIDNVEAGRYPEFPDAKILCDENLLKTACEVCYGLSRRTIASADKFVSDNALKQRLIDEFDAEICDMESAGIVITAKRNGVPALLLKVVSDNADGNSPITFAEIAYGGSLECADILGKVIDKIE